MRIAFALVLAGCGAPEPPVATDSAAPVVCGSANGDLPGIAEELAFDDGTPSLTIHDVDFVLEGYRGTYQTVDEVQWEAVRFELEHPARIHGFSVVWTNLPDDAEPTLELEAGLYPDFGYNGFDFDRWQPLWEGTRCLEDVEDGAFADYVLSEPVTVDHPGLIYVAHKKKDATEPVWWMDEGTAGDGSCADFDECRSAWNFPKLETDDHYNGWSFPLPWDYLVRLHVEYLPSDEPKLF